MNGKTYTIAQADIPEWGGMAKARGELTDAPLGIPVEKSSVFHNPFGNELVDTLEQLGGEIQTLDKMLNEDGTCSGPFTTVLGGCIRFKCPFGGLANPVCHACVGTFAACVLIALLVMTGAA